MTSPGERLRVTAEKVAQIAQAVRDAADRAERAVTDRIEAEAAGREEASGERAGSTDQTQG